MLGVSPKRMDAKGLSKVVRAACSGAVDFLKGGEKVD